MSAKTLYDKLWDSHVITTDENGLSLIYIDRHLLHEVTSPQAFSGLKEAHRPVWRINSNLAVPDHNVPTTGRVQGLISDPISRIQLETLTKNCEENNIHLIAMQDKRQGIVHVIGPEQGITLPGCTLVCGDSHTATHGAFATLAFGIGTSEVEHVLATQCLWQKKMRNMQVDFTGDLPAGVYAKDLILYLIRQIGTAGATGYTIEYTGEAIRQLSMEARMTICNMSIEAGARSGLVAADQKTMEYLHGKPLAPTEQLWQQAVDYWQTLRSDDNAAFDKKITIKASDLAPQVSWGTSPEMVVDITGVVPDPSKESSVEKQESYQQALQYMDLSPGMPMESIELDKIFIGSCTNSRIEDLRIAANVVKGKKVHPRIKQAMVVSGSGLIKLQAEQEGLDQVFKEAGFEWRDPGCSMCIAMNADKLMPGERCASTSNRNFEGRQGTGGRTHLVSPAMAAAAAIFGHFVDVRELL